MSPRVALTALLIVAAPAAAQERQPPYWASIASGQAMMRTGPGRNYPGTWLYQRRDLPIRVLKTYPNWRLIEDPDGTPRLDAGDLAQRPAHRDRKARRPAAGPCQARPSAHVRYLAQQGTVGRIDHCQAGWCHIAIGKREGYIRTSDVWGVGENEVVD